MRPPYDHVIRDLDLLTKLAAFDPVVIGTPPLGIDTDDSDIDIACHSTDLNVFIQTVTRALPEVEQVAVRTVSKYQEPAVVASFRAHGWEIEAFCQTIETQCQWGVRHFQVEQRLLDLEPRLKERVLTLKQAGHKTEPAFATILNLPGDPYEAVAALYPLSDKDLRTLLNRIFS